MHEIANKPIPDWLRSTLNDALGKEKMLFSVVGDLNLESKYDESVMTFTETRIISIDKTADELCRVVKYSDIEEAKSTRYYGNAVFEVKLKSGKRMTMLRYSYAAADVADAAASFSNNLAENGFSEDELEIVKAIYHRQRCFCPKCGKKLPNPDAECINCDGKSKMINKFAVYIKPEKWQLLFCLLLSVLATAFSLVPPYITKIMVDDVIPQKNSTMLVTVISALLGVYVAQYVISALRSYYLRLTGDRIVVALKKDIYEKSQYLPMTFYDKVSTGSVINRVNSDTNVIRTFVMKITQEAVVQAFTLVGLVIIMFSMDVKLALMSLIPIPIVVVAGKMFSSIIKPKYMRLWRRDTNISTLLTDTIPGIRVVKAFTTEKSTVKKFSKYCDEWYIEDKKVAAPIAIFPSVITFLVTCGTLVIWLLGGRMVIRGDSGITLGLLVSFISYAAMFYTPVNFFANIGDSYQNTIASAERILDILNGEAERDFGKGNNQKPIKGKIEFKNVNFAFDRSKKVLNDINLTIEPGDIVGIVGTTGSGKSTLINLLMRYYDEYDGQILVDGKDIRDIDLEYYRNSIGFVQQEPTMFRDTVFNNIAYGCEHPHPEQVINAAEIANAHDFISKLPDSYDTVLGERGVGLSGGEKQRVSIARAVLKNPGILIFDEATAAVDSETENLIQTAIERLISGRTTIMIAHRLSTLRKANKIVVVDQGRIIECGPPDELLAKKGKYYRLVEIQSIGAQLQQKKREENFE